MIQTKAIPDMCRRRLSHYCPDYQLRSHPIGLPVEILYLYLQEPSSAMIVPLRTTCRMLTEPCLELGTHHLG